VMGGGREFGDFKVFIAKSTELKPYGPPLPCGCNLVLDPAVHGMGAPQGVIVSDLIRAE